jgi:hypothetical protein
MRVPHLEGKSAFSLPARRLVCSGAKSLFEVRLEAIIASPPQLLLSAWPHFAAEGWIHMDSPHIAGRGTF